jgi:hypothetical protein
VGGGGADGWSVGEVALLADAVGLGDPAADLVIDLVGGGQPERVQDVAWGEGLDRRNRGESRRRASTTWPSSQQRRGVTAAKLIRTWNAIRVRSGSTVTGPRASINSRSRSKVARTYGSVVAKWSSSERGGAQAWDWLRLTKARWQRGQVHSGRPGGMPAGSPDSFGPPLPRLTRARYLRAAATLRPTRSARMAGRGCPEPARGAAAAGSRADRCPPRLVGGRGTPRRSAAPGSRGRPASAKAGTATPRLACVFHGNARDTACR